MKPGTLMRSNRLVGAGVGVLFGIGMALSISFEVRFNLPPVTGNSVLADSLIKIVTAQESKSTPTAGTSQTAQASPSPLPISPQSLNTGERHTYHLTLTARDFFNLVVEQHGIDVIVRLIGPDGKVVEEVDSPNGTEGPEPVLYVVEQTGQYTLEVQSLEPTGQPGKYELKLEPTRPATDQDKARIEFNRLTTQITDLQNKGNLNEALPLAFQAVEVAERIFGPEDLVLADTLHDLALLLQEKGEYAKAEPFFVRAIAIQEKALGPDHPSVATTLNNLARLYQDTGEYAKAEALYLRSLAIKEKALGPNHPSVATRLNNLARLYQAQGNHDKAEPLFQRVLAIAEKTTDPDDPLVGSALSELASLYCDKGDYAQSEVLYLRALAIKEKALGPDHPLVGTSLNDLALLYYDKGDYAKATPLYLRALAIDEKTSGLNAPSAATTMNNLALIYLDEGDLAQAEGLLLKALAIQEKAFGSEHPTTARTINNLAWVYYNRADYARAETLFKQSLAVKEKTVGPDHPSVATRLNNLGRIYQLQGDYAKAEPLYLRALAIREKKLGPDHPDVANVLNHLAKLYWAKGELPQAIRYQIQTNEVIERDLCRNLVTGSENQKGLYLEQTGYYTDQTISLQTQGAPQNVDALQTAFTVVLRRKGRELDAMASGIESLRRRATPEDQTLLNELTLVKKQLSNLTLKGPEKDTLDVYQARVKALETQEDAVEAKISARSVEYRVQTQPITLEAIQKLIPANAALVEFAIYHPYNVKTQDSGAPHYIVYLMTGSGSIKWVDLGEADRIEHVVQDFRQLLANPEVSPRTLKLSSGTQGVPSNSLKRTAHKLDQLVMKPVRELIGKATHLLISPDGALNLIPFSALMDETNHYLVEKYTVTYLTSGRDLLRLQAKITSQDPPLVLADPNYMEGPGPNLFGQSFQPLSRLKGTHQEGNQLKAIFPEARLKLETEATEAVLKSAVKPQILHIATHGYFLQNDPQAKLTETTRRLEREEEPQSGNAEKIKEKNPLLRSWLFFAGANQGGKEDNDGIMTALEASQLDLWGTQLVVLSACDTGVGDVKNGEGVYGLRRALVLAGSESQMMSLWSVSDKATRELMIDFYTRLKAGEGRSEALRHVQLRMLKDPKRRHPFYWASFIQSGAWGKL
ncbi:MAG: CHAT domain-containing protein [Acidobacteria bacterium]|nr:CHAT domain-containing protein [Acidobacteriota bacterium]